MHHNEVHFKKNYAKSNFHTPAFKNNKGFQTPPEKTDSSNNLKKQDIWNNEEEAEYATCNLFIIY
jgi:hypothetical protein